MDPTVGYFNWLYSIVHDPHMDENYEFDKLLHALGSIDFKPTMLLDTNRSVDGLSLRDEYSSKYMQAVWDSSSSCSVLEMMIALAVRGEKDIMDDPDYGNRIPLWFWGMIENLGLISMTNRHFDRDTVNLAISKFQNHEYSPDGFGGLFTVKSRSDDLRFVDIWTQMAWYFSEQF